MSTGLTSVQHKRHQIRSLRPRLNDVMYGVRTFGCNLRSHVRCSVVQLTIHRRKYSYSLKLKTVTVWLLQNVVSYDDLCRHLPSKVLALRAILRVCSDNNRSKRNLSHQHSVREDAFVGKLAIQNNWRGGSSGLVHCTALTVVAPAAMPRGESRCLQEPAPLEFTSSRRLHSLWPFEIACLS